LIAEHALAFANVEKLSEVQEVDVLCVPGAGSGLNAALCNSEYLTELARLAAMASYVTSVCTGSLLLARAGVLKGRRAACHWASRELLSGLGVEVGTERVVHDGRYISGGGVTAGIDFGLQLAALLSDQRTAEMIQLMLEYDPQPPFVLKRNGVVRSELLEDAVHLGKERMAERRRILGL
jgi:transcriptional regulator GlxA family with amidase domain